VNEPLRLRITNSVEALGQASDAATAWLQANRVPPDAALLANLAIEELVTNCIKYGYADSDEHVIDVDMQVTDGRLEVHVTDEGRAFNPLEVSAPDLSLPLEERPIGGLGLHLLKTMSDAMTYERRDHLNFVTLVKRLEP
jgi:anti-sigma regulatory factor (Ser/Thr protein kinase)